MNGVLLEGFVLLFFASTTEMRREETKGTTGVKNDFCFSATKTQSFFPKNTEGKRQMIFGIKSICTSINFPSVSDREWNCAMYSVPWHEKYSFAHFSSFRIKKEIHSGEKVDKKNWPARGWFHIIKRPFIIQVIIKIVCMFSFGALFFFFVKRERAKEKKVETQTWPQGVHHDAVLLSSQALFAFELPYLRSDFACFGINWCLCAFVFFEMFLNIL